MYVGSFIFHPKKNSLEEKYEGRKLPGRPRHMWEDNIDMDCNCNCNLFAIHTSKIGYKPVDIDTVTYILFSIIYIVNNFGYNKSIIIKCLN
jgi:hypothetical protein